MPKLSIIIPVYNAELYISRCVDSILSQTFTDFELILVDDGSTDSSPRICDQYADYDKRIKVIHTPNNGVGAARNTGLRNISKNSEYIAFVDSDDWTHPELYEKLMSGMSDETDITYCDFNILDKNGQSIYQTFDEGRSIKETISNMLQDGYGGNPWNKLIRRNVIENNNIIFDNYATAQDLLFIAKCFCLSKKAAHIKFPLYYYNLQNNTSITKVTAKTEKKESSYLSVFNDLAQFFKSHNIGDVFIKELSWRVQLLKSDWVLRPEKYAQYFETWKEGDKYLLKNPFIHWKMKIAMLMLNHHVAFPLRIYSYLKKH